VAATVIFDTDILIWAQRGNSKAADLITKTDVLQISVFTYMELLQAASNKTQHKIIKDFLKVFNFTLLPLTEQIGHRALIYIEEYSLSHGTQAGDAVIAATAVEQNAELVTSNQKHFRMIKELKLLVFKP
jgi:predicted nucleic acid-binding protein